MDKCVYIHKHNGVPFYVGKGTTDRAYKLEKSERIGKGTFRGKSYSQFVKSVDFEVDVEVLEYGLNDSDASRLELEIYNSLISSGIKLTNRRVPCCEKQIDYTLVSQNLKYDEYSKTGLVWIKGRYIGKPAGSKSLSGWRVKLEQEEYYCSRIICVLFNIEIESLVVDHKDGNPFNNKISNLRAVNHRTNVLNSKKQCNNTSGVTGVYYKQQSDSYGAYYKGVDGYVYRYFSIPKFGDELALQMAVTFRDSSIEHLKSTGQPYTDRHGL